MGAGRDPRGVGLAKHLGILALWAHGVAGGLAAQAIPAAALEPPTLPGPAESLADGRAQELLELIRAGAWSAAARLESRLGFLQEEAPQLLYLAGVVRWHQEDRVGAIQRFRRAEILGLSTPYLHKALGLAYHEAHQFVLFRQQMERAIAADGSDPQPHFYLGSYLASVNTDYTSARRHLDRVLQLEPGHVQGHALLAYCLEQLDHPEAARAHYRRSVDLQARGAQRSSWAYKGLARLALEGEPEAAKAWSERAVRIEPEDFEAHALLARALLLRGELAEAAAVAAEALRLNPDHAPSHYLLFTVHRRLGNPEAARRHLALFREIKRIHGNQ